MDSTKKQIHPLYGKYLEHFITGVVVHLHGDLASLRSHEWMAGVAVNGWQPK